MLIYPLFIDADYRAAILTQRCKRLIVLSSLIQTPPALVSAPPAVAALPVSWECDLADDSLRWAPGVFDLFGLARGVPVKRSDVVLHYLPESRAELERLRSHAIATCGSFTFEAEIRGFDGYLRWIRIAADVVTRDGRATHLYGSKQEITAEMLARRGG